MIINKRNILFAYLLVGVVSIVVAMQKDDDSSEKINPNMVMSNPSYDDQDTKIYTSRLGHVIFLLMSNTHYYEDFVKTTDSTHSIHTNRNEKNKNRIKKIEEFLNFVGDPDVLEGVPEKVTEELKNAYSWHKGCTLARDGCSYCTPQGVLNKYDTVKVKLLRGPFYESRGCYVNGMFSIEGYDNPLVGPYSKENIELNLTVNILFNKYRKNKEKQK